MAAFGNARAREGQKGIGVLRQPLSPVPQTRLYQAWLQDRSGLAFEDYHALWTWSVEQPQAFWGSLWDYFDLRSPTPIRTVLSADPMPRARWFAGAEVNYAHHVFRHVDAAEAADLPAIVSSDERGRRRELRWTELRRQAAALALHLKAQGIEPGDRVAAYLPNIPETIVAFLAVASLGAVWTLCAPDMGAGAVLDRLRQVEPKALIACDGVVYGGRELDRTATVRELRDALPSVRHLLLVSVLGGEAAARDLRPDSIWDEALVQDEAAVATFEPMSAPFDHPLWILYTSGTSGPPKAIVHSHGGALLMGLATTHLYLDLGPSYAPNTHGERFHWYTSPGWMMWNVQVGALLGGVTCAIYDGNPGRPDFGVLWRFAAEAGVTFFGAGAAYYAHCMKAGLDLAQCGDLSRIRALGATGSPLTEDVQRWGSAELRRAAGRDVWWCNISGGTDFCGAVIGGNRELPATFGEMQCRLLGCAVHAFDDTGGPAIDEVGELVLTQPLPSMPLYFWGDREGRLYEGYFEMFPGVWRHGDWLKVTSRGTCVIYGRSDATINRQGLRMGTSEIYKAVEALPEVVDSLLVDLEYLGRDSYMPLFVVLRPGAALDEHLRARINRSIRESLSPRFIPDDIFEAPAVPRTLSGKKQELPIKKLLLGRPAHEVLVKDAMANPECLGWYEQLAGRLLSQHAGEA